MKYSVLALLLASTEAVKLKQLTFNNLLSRERDAADEVDPDDKDIDDGKISSKEDITIFTDSFVNKGESVKSISAQAAKERKNKLESMGLDTYNNNEEQSAAGSSPYPLPAKKEKKKKEKKTKMIQDAIPQPKKEEAPKTESKQNLVEKKPEIASKDEIENTNMWAHAAQTEEKNSAKDSEDLQTSSMSKSQKSELLHQVSNSAFDELKDDADPTRVPKTEQQLVDDRMKQAGEVEAQTIDLDKKTFSANDLKDFTSLTEQQSSETQSKMDKAENSRKNKIGEKTEDKLAKSKDMYEELYDNKSMDVLSA